MEALFDWLWPAVSAHPYAATAVSVATVIVMAQPLLRALVEWTPTEVDNKVLELVLKVANLLTPAKSKRGAAAVRADAALEALVADMDADSADAIIREAGLTDEDKAALRAAGLLE